MTLTLYDGRARAARWWMAGLSAGMVTSSGPNKGALCLALHAFRLHRFDRFQVADRVTRYRAQMVSASQLAPTRPAAGARLRVPTRQLDRVVASQAGRRYLLFALGMRQFQDLHHLRPDVPRSRGLPFLVHSSCQHRGVASGLAGMLAQCGVVGEVADFAADRTVVALVTVVQVLVVARGGLFAGQLALGRLRFTSTTTLDFDHGARATTLQAGL